MPRLHRGDKYPLALRRDYNVGLNRNTLGLARDYYFVIDNIEGVLGPHIFIPDLRLKENDQLHIDPPSWLSDITRINGRDIWAKLWMSELHPLGYMQHKWELHDVAAGILGRGEGGISGTYAYGVLAGFADIGFVPKPAIFKYAGFSALYNFSAVPWGDFES